MGFTIGGPNLTKKIQTLLDAMTTTQASDFDRAKHSQEFIGQEVYESEKHVHSRERWCGAADGWDGTNQTDATDPNNLDAFQIDAGNDTWGTSYCVMGSGDSPIISGMTKYDAHRLLITEVENAKVAHKKIRLAWGDGYALGIEAGNYTEFVFIPISNRAGNAPLEIQMPRLDAGTKLFASMWAFGEDTCTADFIIGIHEYIY